MQITVRKPTNNELKNLDINSWNPWSCDIERFTWEYSTKETAYILEGRVIVETDDGTAVELEPGDLVTFPAGLKCTWDVQEPIRKVFLLG